MGYVLEYQRGARPSCKWWRWAIGALILAYVFYLAADCTFLEVRHQYCLDCGLHHTDTKWFGGWPSYTKDEETAVSKMLKLDGALAGHVHHFQNYNIMTYSGLFVGRGCGPADGLGNANDERIAVWLDGLYRSGQTLEAEEWRKKLLDPIDGHRAADKLYELDLPFTPFATPGDFVNWQKSNGMAAPMP